MVLRWALSPASHIYVPTSFRSEHNVVLWWLVSGIRSGFETNASIRMSVVGQIWLQLILFRRHWKRYSETTSFSIGLLLCVSLWAEFTTILRGFRAHGGFETNASIGMSAVGQIWLQLIYLVVTESVIRRPPIFRSVCCYALAFRSNLATILRDFLARIWSM